MAYGDLIQNANFYFYKMHYNLHYVKLLKSIQKKEG